jgi:hypothetical protein
MEVEAMYIAGALLVVAIAIYFLWLRNTKKV